MTPAYQTELLSPLLSYQTVHSFTQEEVSVFSISWGVSVKVNFVQLGVMQAQNGGRGIALPLVDLGTRSGWVVNATPRPLCLR